MEFTSLLQCFVILTIFVNTKAVRNTTRDDDEVYKLSAKTTHEVLKKAMASYDDRSLPSKNGEAVKVDISIMIADVDVPSAKSMYMKLDVYFRMFWNDYRLSIRDFLQPEIRNSTIQPITLDASYKDNIWRPELIFENGHIVAVDTITTESGGITLSADGDIMFSQRLFVTLFCPMDLSMYPFDHQSCHLGIESYLYDNRSMNLNWKNIADIYNVAAVEKNFDQSLTHFTYEGIKINKDVSNDHFTKYPKNALNVIIKIKRNILEFMIDQYLPAVMIVIFSFIGFSVDYHSVPARTSLGIVTVLSIITLVNSEKKSRTSTMMDWYLFICFIFVFIGFIEFILINITDQISMQKQRQQQTKKKIEKDKRSPTSPNNSINNNDDVLSFSSTNQTIISPRDSILSTNPPSPINSSSNNDDVLSVSSTNQTIISPRDSILSTNPPSPINSSSNNDDVLSVSSTNQIISTPRDNTSPTNQLAQSPEPTTSHIPSISITTPWNTSNRLNLLTPRQSVIKSSKRQSLSLFSLKEALIEPKKTKRDVHVLDSISKVLFPFMFLVFNIIYICIASLNKENDEH